MEAKTLTAQAKQHLQEVNDRCNLMEKTRQQKETYFRSLLLPREECIQVEQAEQELLEVNKQEDHVVVCEQEKRYDS